MNDKMSKSIESHLTKIADKWDNLPTRERLALLLLALFLFAVFGLFGSWKIHQESRKQQAIYDKKLNDFFWLRGQSGNLKNQGNASNDLDQPFNLQVSQSIQRSGIQNPQVVGSNEAIQFSFEDSSQALVSKVITDMQNQGWQLNRLSIKQKEGQSFHVQGTISSTGQ